MRRAALLLAVAVAACSLAASTGGPRLDLDAKVAWRESWQGFGGFSGLEVLDGGTRFLTISDRGFWATGTMERRDGTLIAAHIARRGRLHEISGKRVRSGSYDAEGLTMDAQGRPYVSYEGFHRVRRYNSINAAATALPSDPDFAKLQGNSGLEAIAIDRDGTLYAIPERSGKLDRPFPVYRLRDGVWDKPFRIPREGNFLISDASIGPEGDLYVLERDFSWLGFRTRVRRFTIGPDALGNETTLLETSLNQLDNMEGISVWRDPEGHTRVTLLSDDNFFPLQQTLFAEYLLVGDEARPTQPPKATEAAR